MLCWIDKDSGTYGVDNDSIVLVDMNDTQEEIFSELSDNDRIQIARGIQEGREFGVLLCEAIGYHDSGDNPVDSDGAAECEVCGEKVNAVPDCENPDPECAEHNGACD